MIYANIIPGIFLSRPNRFIAHVSINGNIEAAHVKNTGRCRELLIPGVPVYLQCHSSSERKTKFSLIAVEKGGILINMDSQAPNGIWQEALAGGIKLPGFSSITHIKREATYGKSRLDFYVEGINDGQPQKAYMEVKGCTLEENGVARFPDAPTERGIKHIQELIHLADSEYLAYIVFIIQMSGIRYFTPNDITHPAFGDTLREAEKRNVNILAYECDVTPAKICIAGQVPVVL